MAFAFTHQRGVAQQVRSIAADEAGRAVEEAQAGLNFDQTIHRLRRRCKKLRGLLRLVEPDFEAFKVENAAIRAAAERLGGMRDAVVLVETFAALAADAEGISPELADAVHKRLADRVGQVGAAQTREDLLGGFADSLDAFAVRATAWSFMQGGPPLILDGLRLTYKRMRKGLERAMEQPGDAEVLHEWRKHVKYHLFHAKLFGRAAPEVLQPRLKMLDDLADTLGDHHNLAVLSHTLENEGDLADAGLEAVDAAIGSKQARLADEAFHLGRQLCVEKPGVLAERFTGYWRLLPRDAPDGD